MRWLGIAIVIASVADATPKAQPLQDLQKVGEAKLEIMFWDIYQSTLYSANGRYRKDTWPLALEIEYLRDITAKALIKRSVKEWKNVGVEPVIYQKWLPQLTQIWPDIKRGDRLLLFVDSQRANQFYFNGEPIGSIDDNNFGATFLAIWLDDNASFPKLRRKLTGADNAK